MSMTLSVVVNIRKSVYVVVEVYDKWEVRDVARRRDVSDMRLVGAACSGGDAAADQVHRGVALHYAHPS